MVKSPHPHPRPDGLRVLMDASALTKRYVLEAGRDRVVQLFGEATELLVAAHCQSEVASALLQRKRDGALPLAEFDRAWAAAQRDVADMVRIPLDSQVERLAFAALQFGPLGTLDALHLGSALAANVDLFVTADPRQALAARGLGLPTEFLDCGAGIPGWELLT